MKLGEAIETLQYFFLDLIGVIIPGAALIIGIGVLFKFSIITVPIIPDDYYGVLLITLSYVIGHWVTSLGNTAINISNWLAGIGKKIPLVRKVIPDSMKTRDQLFQEILKSQSFIQFRQVISQTPYFSSLRGVEEESNVGYWRDIAMTFAKDEKNTIYKFMFISLLTSGVGTVLVLLSIIWVASSLLNQFAGAQFHVIPINYWMVALMLLVSSFFFERYATFYSMSMRVPFAIATAKLASDAQQDRKVKESPELIESTDKRPRVYLAGGFKSNWQDVLTKRPSGFEFLDPRVHQRTNEDEYTIWDLDAIRKSDWIFAYLEKTNPAGYALALEVGYAKALAKRIILVDEKSSGDANIRSYLGMLYSCADITFTSFDDAIKYLHMLEQVVQRIEPKNNNEQQS